MWTVVFCCAICGSKYLRYLDVHIFKHFSAIISLNSFSMCFDCMLPPCFTPCIMKFFCLIISPSFWNLCLCFLFINFCLKNVVLLSLCLQSFNFSLLDVDYMWWIPLCFFNLLRFFFFFNFQHFWLLFLLPLNFFAEFFVHVAEFLIGSWIDFLTLFMWSYSKLDLNSSAFQPF
jgi:hypothetical protein